MSVRFTSNMRPERLSPEEGSAFFRATLKECEKTDTFDFIETDLKRTAQALFDDSRALLDIADRKEKMAYLFGDAALVLRDSGLTSDVEERMEQSLQTHADSIWKEGVDNKRTACAVLQLMEKLGSLKPRTNRSGVSVKTAPLIHQRKRKREREAANTEEQA